MTVANRSPAPTVQNLPDNRASVSLISRSATTTHPVRWIRAYQGRPGSESPSFWGRLGGGESFGQRINSADGIASIT